jgi:hypothetical protein
MGKRTPKPEDKPEQWDLVAGDGTPIEGPMPLSDDVVEGLARLLREAARKQAATETEVRVATRGHQ